MFYVLAFAVGLYVGKAHYDQFMTLVKTGWDKFTDLFKKKPTV